MTSIREKINLLLHKKQKLEEVRGQVHENRINMDIAQFYEDSKNLINVGNGMAILITPEGEEREFTDRTFDNLKAAQIMINRTPYKRDLNMDDKWFIDTLTEDCNSVFISMSSVMSDPTVVYMPEKCSEYQVERLKSFNKDVKQFNDNQVGMCHIRINYDGLGDTTVRDLDYLIENIETGEKQSQK